MKITKFVVVSCAKSVGLFPVVTPSGLYAGWDRETLLATFSDDPVLFRLSHARFMVREMRRSGYFVCFRPYFLYVVKAFFKKLRERRVLRREKKSLWRK